MSFPSISPFYEADTKVIVGEFTIAADGYSVASQHIPGANAKAVAFVSTGLYTLTLDNTYSRLNYGNASCSLSTPKGLVANVTGNGSPNQNLGVSAVNITFLASTTATTLGSAGVVQVCLILRKSSVGT